MPSRTVPGESMLQELPAHHRCLLLLGTGMLTNAAFERFAGTCLPGHFFNPTK